MSSEVRLTYEQFGDRVGDYSKRQVVRWVKDGKVKPRYGGRPFFLEEDVIRVKRQMEEGTFGHE